MFIISIVLFLLGIAAVFLFQNLGWRKGELIFMDENLLIEGEIPINIKKNGILTLDHSWEGTSLSWYSYYVIEFSSKKYDIKIKCRKKHMDSVLEALREYEIGS